MTEWEWSFEERLAMSEGIATTSAIDEILLDAIPGAVAVRAATQAENRAGTDRWVDRVNGDSLSVDTKIREADWAAKYGEDDLALEVWSVVEEAIPGWTRNPEKRHDYILWYWQDTGRWCCVSFPMLCSVFTEHLFAWHLTYKVARQNTDGRYHSECVFVPRRVVWAAIYERFGGVPKVAA